MCFTECVWSLSGELELGIVQGFYHFTSYSCPSQLPMSTREMQIQFSGAEMPLGLVLENPCHIHTNSSMENADGQPWLSCSRPTEGGKPTTEVPLWGPARSSLVVAGDPPRLMIYVREAGAVASFPVEPDLYLCFPGWGDMDRRPLTHGGLSLWHCLWLVWWETEGRETWSSRVVLLTCLWTSWGCCWSH